MCKLPIDKPCTDNIHPLTLELSKNLHCVTGQEDQSAYRQGETLTEGTRQASFISMKHNIYAS